MRKQEKYFILSEHKHAFIFKNVKLAEHFFTGKIPRSI